MKEVELEINDINYDTGYGVHNGDLYITINPILENQDFDFDGPQGLSTHKVGNQLVDFKIESATLFLVGNNGAEIGEVELNESEVLKLVNKDYIFKELTKVY